MALEIDLGGESIFAKRIERRNESIYIKLFDEYYKSLTAVAFNYVLDRDVADDIVQETFIHLFYNIEKISDVKNLKGYLRVSVRNRCISYLKQLDIEDTHKILYQREMELIGDDDSDTEELSVVVNQLLEVLPRSCKQICKLRFLDGYKIEEISKKLSLSKNTIKVQIHRGISKIKNGVPDGVTLYDWVSKKV
ncbi:RNA polymerase sigma factor [Limibacterium fermenti]|uniref:RNA polymerase sigma factor n=1 Tax=Limibacterium fermenti TaxID=3229863 RepID=UPI003A5D4A68